MPRRLLLDGDDLGALMQRVRTEMGPDAVVVKAERVRTGGVAGFFAKERFEVTVEVPDPRPGRLPDAAPGAVAGARPVGMSALLDAADAADGADGADAGSTGTVGLPTATGEPAVRVSTDGETFARLLASIDDLAGPRSVGPADDVPGGPRAVSPVSPADDVAEAPPVARFAPRGTAVTPAAFAPLAATAGGWPADGVGAHPGEPADGSAPAPATAPATGADEPVGYPGHPVPTRQVAAAAFPRVPSPRGSGAATTPATPGVGPTAAPASAPAHGAPTLRPVPSAAPLSDPLSDPVPDPAPTLRPVPSAAPLPDPVPDPAPTPAAPASAVVPSLTAPPSVPSAEPVGSGSTRGALAGLGLPAALLGAGPADEPLDLSGLRVALPRPPALLRRPGALVAVVGEGPSSIAIATALAQRARLDPHEVLLAGDLPPVQGHGPRLLSPAAAARHRAEAASGVAVSIVAVGVGPEAEDRAAVAPLLAELAPDQVWAVVDARRKTSDLRAWLRFVGASHPVDAVAATWVHETQEPGTVLDLGAPVGWIDGLPATPVLWAALLGERLDPGAGWD